MRNLSGSRRSRKRKPISFRAQQHAVISQQRNDEGGSELWFCCCYCERMSPMTCTGVFCFRCAMFSLVIAKRYSCLLWGLNFVAAAQAAATIVHLITMYVILSALMCMNRNGNIGSSVACNHRSRLFIGVRFHSILCLLLKSISYQCPFQ